MFMVFLGVIGAVISMSFMADRNTPVEQPKGQFEIVQAKAGGGSGSEPVMVRPMSEFKYRNIARQQYDYSCGSAALVTLLNYHLGLPVTEQQAMEGMLEKGEKQKIIERRGFSLLDMKRYLASIGVDSGGFRAKLDDLAKLEHPAVVPIDYGGFKHFVVLRGLRDGRAYIADPSAGNFVLEAEEFARWWDRNTLFIVYPQKDQPAIAKLALTDQELGVMDADRVREGIELDRGMALRRAVDNMSDLTSLRRR